jgi:hypothetical protein
MRGQSCGVAALRRCGVFGGAWSLRLGAGGQRSGKSRTRWAPTCCTSATRATVGEGAAGDELADACGPGSERRKSGGQIGAAVSLGRFVPDDPMTAAGHLAMPEPARLTRIGGPGAPQQEATRNPNVIRRPK